MKIKTEDYIKIKKLYDYWCKTPTDINEHLPTIKKYADQCTHVTEFGVYLSKGSTWAFLMACSDNKSIKYISYDDKKRPQAIDTWNLVKNMDIDWTFNESDTTLMDPIEETDLLLIDTEHVYDVCSKELEVHASKVRKFIIFHDTVSRWDISPHPGSPSWLAKGNTRAPVRGIGPAITEFLEDNKNWTILENRKNNNGLMIIANLGKKDVE